MSNQEAPRYNVNRHNDEAIAAAVDREVPKELISSRSSGNSNTVSYLKGDIDADRLNEIFGPLGWGVVASAPEISKFEDKRTKWEKPREGGRAVSKEVDMTIYAVTTQVTLTIKARTPESTDTVFTQTGVGYGEVEPGKHAKDAIGMAVKGAETDGLKRCATLIGKAFGMFLNADGSQSDIEYAHRNNRDGLAKAKNIRSQAAGRSPGRSRPSETEADAHPRGRDEQEARGDARRSRASEGRSAPERDQRQEPREQERSEPEGESRRTSARAPSKKDEGGQAPKRERPKGNYNDDADLNSEPVTRQDQIDYGFTFVRHLDEAASNDEREALVRKHRRTIFGLDGVFLDKIRAQAKKHDLDIDRIKD